MIQVGEGDGGGGLGDGEGIRRRTFVIGIVDRGHNGVATRIDGSGGTAVVGDGGG